MQWLTTFNTWFIKSKDSITLWIAIIGFFLSIWNLISKWLDNRTHLTVEVKNTYRLASNILFLELAITNHSRKQTVLQRTKISIQNEHFGSLYDARQIMKTQEVAKGFKEATYITAFPIIIPPLGCDRFWVRYDFENEIPELLDETQANISLVFFGKEKLHPVSLPKRLTLEELFKNT